MRALISLCLLLAVLSGCESNPSAPSPDNWQPFSGSVVWVPDGYGFWALRVDGIGKVNPMALPSSVHEDGLRVAGELNLRSDLQSAKKWGVVAEVREVSASD